MTVEESTLIAKVLNELADVLDATEIATEYVDDEYIQADFVGTLSNVVGNLRKRVEELREE